MTAESAAPSLKADAAPPARAIQPGAPRDEPRASGSEPSALGPAESSGPDPAALWEAVRGLVAGSASQSGAVDLFELKSVRGRSAEIVVRDPSKAGIARSWVSMVSGLLSKAAGASMNVTLADPDAVRPQETHAAGGTGGQERTLRLTAPGPGGGPSVGARVMEVDAAARAAALEQPLVKKAVELFNARLIGVEDDPEVQGTADRGPGTGD